MPDAMWTFKLSMPVTMRSSIHQLHKYLQCKGSKLTCCLSISKSNFLQDYPSLNKCLKEVVDVVGCALIANVQPVLQDAAATVVQARSVAALAILIRLTQEVCFN